MKTKSLIKHSLSAGLLAGLLVSCQPHTMYHSFHTLPQDGWNKSDTLVFPVPARDVRAGLYELQIEIRHTKEFAYRSIWIVVYQNTKDSARFTADTLQCSLANEKGRFTGSGLNNYYQQSFPLKTIVLNDTCPPVFKLTHCMKKGRMEGIHDIGIRLTKRH